MTTQTTAQNPTAALHDATNLAYVHLSVSDLARSLDYYQQSLGFQVISRESSTAYLGAGREPLLALTEKPGAKAYRGVTGLYHFAILTPSRVALAKSLKNLSDTRTQIDGASDHLVSEALYLSDPDGNGIEIYRDRPRNEWPYLNGNLRMASDPFDFDGVLGAYDGSAWTGLHADTVLGHMHLHVANLRTSVAFYRDVIGFALIMSYGAQAAFLSAGGYHHHLGVNTWAGQGAPQPPADAVGLRYWVVRLANTAERDALVARLDAAGVSHQDEAGALVTHDPANNQVRFVVA